MRKIIIIYGLIAGFITGGMLLLTMQLYQSNSLNLDNGMLIGYTTMVIALSVIFIAIKTIRDNHLGGVITFWKGCQIGLLITLIASIIYALAWEVSFSKIGDEYMKKSAEHYEIKLKADRLSAEEIKEKKSEMDRMWSYYRNPVIRFAITLTEILPVGLIMSLAAAGLLRKKEFLPGKE